MQNGKVCAAVVLYEPDAVLLRRQAEGMAGIDFFAFANGSLQPDVIAAMQPARLHLLQSSTNIGLARGLNAVMDAAARQGFNHVFLLDQDSEPTVDLLSALTEWSMKLERAGKRLAAVGPQLIPPSEGFFKPIRYEWREGSGEDGCAAVNFLPTSGSLISVSAYDVIGPFRDDFFIAGIDVEWGFRAWDKGFSSYVVTDLSMLHRWGEEVSEKDIAKPQILRHRPVRNYYYARNVVATAKLAHVPLLWRIGACARLAIQIGVLAAKGKPGEMRPIRLGLRDGFLGRLGPAPGGFTL